MLTPEIRTALLAFRRERDWEPFHTPKNLAISLTLEASELLQLFQWEDKQGQALAAMLPRIQEEVADVAMYLTYLCEDLGIDLEQAVKAKMEHNRQKYPVEKCKGSAKKYTEL